MGSAQCTSKVVVSSHADPRTYTLTQIAFTNQTKSEMSGNKNHVVDVSNGLEFSDQPLQLSCSSCYKSVITDVSSEISSTGWMFAVCCCLFGSWIASCLVRCLPGFRKYYHHCPSCRVLLGEVEPKHSSGHLAIIILVSLAAMAVVGAFIFFRFISR